MNEKQGSLLENLRGLPRGAWVLFLGTFLNKFGAFVLPFLAIYMTRLGFTSAEAGLAIGAYGIGTLAASLTGGYLADRIGRRKTIVLSMASVAIAMLCLSQARSFSKMLFLSGMAGFTGELYRPASSALLTDLVPPGLRVTAFAAYRMSLNAGWAFGPATAGLLAKSSFTWLFIGDAATSLLFGLVAWFALPRGLLRSEDKATGFVEGFRLLRGDPRFQRVLISSLVIGMVFVQVFSTMSLEITSSGLSASTYGLIISLNGLMVVLFELPLTTVTKHYTARRVMAVGYLLIGAGFASNVLPRTIPLLVLTVALFTFGEMISMPVSAAYVAELAPSDRRGFYMGMYGLVWSLAFVFGPSLGMLAFSLNPLGLWGSCGVLGLVAAGIILSVRRPRSRPQAVFSRLEPHTSNEIAQ